MPQQVRVPAKRNVPDINKVLSRNSAHYRGYEMSIDQLDMLQSSGSKSTPVRPPKATSWREQEKAEEKWEKDNEAASVVQGGVRGRGARKEVSDAENRKSGTISAQEHALAMQRAEAAKNRSRPSLDQIAARRKAKVLDEEEAEEKYANMPRPAPDPEAEHAAREARLAAAEKEKSDTISAHEHALAMQRAEAAKARKGPDIATLAARRKAKVKDEEEVDMSSGSTSPKSRKSPPNTKGMSWRDQEKAEEKWEKDNEAASVVQGGVRGRGARKEVSDAEHEEQAAISAQEHALAMQRAEAAKNKPRPSLEQIAARRKAKVLDEEEAEEKYANMAAAAPPEAPDPEAERAAREARLAEAEAAKAEAELENQRQIQALAREAVFASRKAPSIQDILQRDQREFKGYEEW